jgi:hypothetical protein
MSERRNRRQAAAFDRLVARATAIPSIYDFISPIEGAELWAQAIDQAAAAELEWHHRPMSLKARVAEAEQLKAVVAPEVWKRIEALEESAMVEAYIAQDLAFQLGYAVGCGRQGTSSGPGRGGR